MENFPRSFYTQLSLQTILAKQILFNSGHVKMIGDALVFKLI